MAVNLYNLKKWLKMITGKSIMHVKQGVGKTYSVNAIKGYYNDLTSKVTLDKEHYTISDVFPHKSQTFDKGVQDVYFPIAIFQYGLGAYDLYLLESDELMLEKFKTHVAWAMNNQNEDGSWDNFGFINPDAKYSSMAQSEGCSLLLRAYIETNDIKYYNAAKKALEFMIRPLKDGGTTSYNDEEVYLCEYTNSPVVLNGWIFSIFGLYDYLLVNPEDITMKEIYNKTVTTLSRNLNKFDNGFWSMYDMGNLITSPFYHNLHISQLDVMYDITDMDVFKKYADIFRNYEKNKLNKMRAFVKKALQKIMEK